MNTKSSFCSALLRELEKREAKREGLIDLYRVNFNEHLHSVTGTLAAFVHRITHHKRMAWLETAAAKKKA